MNKFCPRCQTDKPAQDFGTNKSRSDGLAGWCKTCMREAVVAWKKANPERNAIHNKVYYENRKLRDQGYDRTD